ncbi:late secretory pathway protein AVL9 homolog isoform X2 [Onychostoma macrolepis]|uniref:late secretory pathway protein AVL9 homolog isoform X2 n=1 Tax=Onychostoma macrolepis TaxID=369639 RepID=UPI00272AB807|nr:late secretory pathway protein AVL9 homolog isoform X2 [Onychostoma macrolepis]
MESQCKEELVLHIVVVGFHHKKGCQVEFSYPPIIPGAGHDSNTLPEEWKYLPFLALPDGAHNHQEDAVYFHLPPLDGQQKCVYGVSCYRQMEAKALKVREADITRETVQKSVCVLSRLPLFGLIQAKLQLITHAYFEEKDFSQISILKELYEHMNRSLSCTALEGSQIYLGLSARDLILHFKHKVLILFKLILLEKKILFYVNPVKRLVETLMTVLSLFPGIIEHGLEDSSHYQPRRSLSDDFSSPEVVSADEESLPMSGTDNTDISKELEGRYDVSDQPDQSKPCNTSLDTHYLQHHAGSLLDSQCEWETLEPHVMDEMEGKVDITHSNMFDTDSGLPITVQPQSATGQGMLTSGLVSGLQEDQYGLPLAIFTKGYLCMPYMALQQHHLLSDISVRGFVAGATNILFRQQRHLSDAIVDIMSVCWQIMELHSHPPGKSHTTTECGSATSIQPWPISHQGKASHPFQGQYSVADVKIRLSHSVQNSERGKKIGNAVMSTSRSVVQTGKAVGQSVGGALTVAKSAMSSWFSMLAQPTTAVSASPQSAD